MTAFDTALFMPLVGGKGQTAEVIIQKRVSGERIYTNIIGLRRVGSQEFDTDGKTPVIHTSREPGKTSLF